MLLVGSALKGYAIAANDGGIGTVSDFLFDDTTWKVRWMVVDTGSWLNRRKILVHPSVIGETNHARREIPVRLTKAQVEASPDISQDEPVSRQMERHLYHHYGWDPLWGGGSFFGGYGLGMGSLFMPVPYGGATPPLDEEHLDIPSDDGDPHLCSIAAVTGYHVHATDGRIGHIENFLVDDETWGIRYLIIDTRNWWPGRHVLVSPYAVREISWSDSEVRIDISRDQIKNSPPWDPVDLIDRAYEKRLHDHYGWPGYGW